DRSLVLASLASYLSSCFFLFHCSGAHPPLPSFPTRRSSDLLRLRRPGARRDDLRRLHRGPGRVPVRPEGHGQHRHRGSRLPARRSEEHTSELQSLTNLVCRLLLEKKKPRHYRHSDTALVTIT